MTAREMILLIVGRTKLPYNELFYLSRKELLIIIKGHEIDLKELTDNFRVHASLTLRPHVKKEDQSKLQPNKLWPMPWDKKEKKANPQAVSKVKKLAEIYRSGKIIPKSNGESKNRS